MTRPLLLDLFCCAGGAAKGYHQAGFDVVGVDKDPQKRYPYQMQVEDALYVLAALSAGRLVTFTSLDGGARALRLSDFTAIHASPPCQGYTVLRHAPGTVGAPRLIGPVRELLKATGLPYVIENVEEARAEMLDPVLLCGETFGLGCRGEGGRWFDLQRHRLFENNWGLREPHHFHSGRSPIVGVYGGHARNRAATFGGRGARGVWPQRHKPAMGQALGIDWMTTAELSEALPPAYTQYVGEHLLEHLRSTT